MLTTERMHPLHKRIFSISTETRSALVPFESLLQSSNTLSLAGKGYQSPPPGRLVRITSPLSCADEDHLLAITCFLPSSWEFTTATYRFSYSLGTCGRYRRVATSQTEVSKIDPFGLEIFSQEHLPLTRLLLPRTHDPFEVWYDTPCY